MINPKYLQPISDGLVARLSGSWVKEKLDYLQRYIYIFETSMKSKWKQRNYIDLFAGPGKDVIKDSGEFLLGSPLLALVTRYPFTGYYFSDLNSSNIEALKTRCADTPLCKLVNTYHEDANKVVSKVVTEINQSSPKSLNLAFLDPTGLDLEWNTVAKLGTLRCDLIIHYSQQGVSRYIGKAYLSKNETKIDRFFGSDEWRGIYSQWHNKPHRTGLHRELLDFYKDRLRSIGYQDVIQSDQLFTEPLIRSHRRKTPLYRLLFASKHPLGEEFWQKITHRDMYGQKQMF